MSSSKLFVGGIAYSTDDTSLQEAFSEYGEVVEARVTMDRETGRSRGFGFVSFTSSEEAATAIQGLDGKDLHGSVIRVNYVTERAPRYGGSGGYGGGGSGGYGGGGGSYGGDGYRGGGYGGGGYRKIQFFMETGFCRDEVDWVLNSFPQVLGFGIESRLIPLLREFEDLGFSKELVRKEIVRNPRVFGMEVGELSRCLDLLRTLKCRESIKLKIFGDGAFRAAFEVKLRVDCLCKHGLIRREALKVLWKEPRVIIYGVDEIEKKIGFLVNTMGFNISCLFDVPAYLGVSFEKQIVPRYNVIEYLRAKGGLGDEVGLKDMIKMSRLKFYNFYVKPYPECEKFFGRFSRNVQVKNQHPPGLWKLFKPQRPLESKEDVKNFKSFMETLA